MQLMPIRFLFLTNLVIHVDSNWQSLLRDSTVIMYNGKPFEKNLQSADWCHLVSGPRTVKKCGEVSRTYTVRNKRSCISQEMSNVGGTLGTYEVIIILLHLFSLSNTYIQHTHHKLLPLEGFMTHIVLRTNLCNICIKCIKWILNIRLSVHKFHFQNHKKGFLMNLYFSNKKDEVTTYGKQNT